MLGAPGYPVSAALTFDIFAEPLLAELAGAPRRAAARGPGPGWPASWPLRSAWTTGSGCGSGVVGGTMVATPLPRGAGVLTSLVRADGLLVVPAGQEGHHPGEEVDVELLRGLDEISRTIVAIGSHDLVLDLAASALRAEDPPVTLASSNVGSLGGLVALRDGLCHLAGSHLLDPATGEYTLPYVDRLLGGHRGRRGPAGAPGPGPDRRARQPARPAAASRTWPGPGVRYVNRQRGAGTRVLLDHELGRARHQPRTRSTATPGRSPPTWRWPRPSPRAAATRAWASWPPRAPSAWTSCRSPASLTTWWWPPDAMDGPLLAPLWALLRSDRFQAAVTDLGGYSTKEMGRRLQ